MSIVLNIDEMLKLQSFFEYNNYSIRNSKCLLEYLSKNHYFRLKEDLQEYPFIKTEKVLFEEIHQDKIWYHEKDEYFYKINEEYYLNITLIEENLRELIINGLIILNDKPYHNILEVDMEFMENLSDDYSVTVYISDSVAHYGWGYYTVHGKIFYDENPEHFDYYSVKAWTRRQVHEYYSRIRKK